MGLSQSKTGKIPDEHLSEGNVPSTPILTNKVIKNCDLDVDPRSPSANIARTPIQFLTPNKLVSANCSQVESETPIKTTSGSKILLGIDPRSPTTDFPRTPIVINAADLTMPQKLYNKNLENVRKACVIVTTPMKAKPEAASETPMNIVPPKLLESSPIVVKPNANKRKSFVGLLETNIDFTETDLDTVIRLKTENGVVKFESPIENKHLSVAKNENSDPRSPSTDFLRTPIIRSLEKLAIDDSVEAFDDVLAEEELEVAEPTEEQVVAYEEVPEQIEVVVPEELVVETASEEPDDLEPIVDSENVIETENEMITPDRATKANYVIDVSASVREFDKKLTNLIYEDESLVCPKVFTVKENCRTPLGVRNIKSEPKKSTQKLKVSDKPRKSDYVVSKIPVFKDKRDVQCENTPPMNLDKRRVKVKKSHWDGDNTLVI